MEVLALMRGGQLVGRVVGDGKQHDEHGLAVLFGAFEFIGGVAEHIFVGDAPCGGHGLRIAGFDGVFVNDFVCAEVADKVVKIAPAAVACGDIDNAVACFFVGREQVGGEGFVFGERLADVVARRADKEAVERVAGAVALGYEFVVHPILLPMGFQAA